MTRRRAMMALALVAVSPFARSQGAMKRLGVLGFVEHLARWKELLPKEFEAHGFRQGRNLDIRWFEIVLQPRLVDTAAAARAKVAEMMRADLDCIMAYGVPGTRFLQEATTTIPIVTYVPDPVAAGFAKSLARPGGNITGLHDGIDEVDLKAVELLKKLLPKLTCVACVVSKPLLPAAATLETAAGRLGVRVRTIVIDGGLDESLPQLRNEFASLRREGCLALQEVGLPPIPELHAAIRKIAIEHRIALSGFWIQDEGAFVAYVPERDSQQAAERRMPAIVARILRGEKPGGIPFEGPTKYELYLNLKTAAKLGISVPPDVLLLATQVVQ